jgi:hypothetical protein
LKTPRWHTCNILDARLERRQLWQFGRDNTSAKLASERVILSTDPLPERQVSRTLHDLWQPKLNVAWLPSSQVMVRVVHLPPSEPKELPGMVELQLERLSPLPVAQIVWTFEALPAPEGQPQTVIVIIAARNAVEAFLDDLEGHGYLPDRLELPQVQELLSTDTKGDGVWILPREEGGKTVCLVAWWSGGQLHNLNLLALPSDETAGPHLVELLKQIAWAGEMEGWLGHAPQWHLLADPGTAARLEGTLRDFAGSAVDLRAPLRLADVAAQSALCTTRANLVPVEYTTRYRQQFIDRLWMRGLGALGLAYLFCVLGYFAALQVVEYQKSRVDEQVAFMTVAYTNALQLKAKVMVLQEQVNLKFAALDCWKAASEALPAEMTLTALTFQRGKKLGIFGTVPSDQQAMVTTYNQALARAMVNTLPLFSQVATKNIQGSPVGQGNRPMNWSVECEIRRSDL